MVGPLTRNGTDLAAAMEKPRVLVTYRAGEETRAAVGGVLGAAASVTFLGDLTEPARAAALGGADVLLSLNPERELRPEELRAIGHVRLIQLTSAGADHVPFAALPEGVPVAGNVGAYAEPIAEHVLAMALALAKRLTVQHAKLARGEFDYRTVNRMLGGAAWGIVGFGGIGRAVARLARALGGRIHAINRSGRAEEPVEFIGTPGDLDHVLASSDVLVLSLPLTPATRGLIGRRELGLMKPDAILVNVARGAIVDEDALWEHLTSHPDFMAGIDTWWVEPFREGEFRMRHPFLELPNVLGSPHNSAIAADAIVAAERRAALNVLRFLRGEPVPGLLRREDYGV